MSQCEECKKWDKAPSGICFTCTRKIDTAAYAKAMQPACGFAFDCGATLSTLEYERDRARMLQKSAEEAAEHAVIARAKEQDIAERKQQTLTQELEDSRVSDTIHFSDLTVARIKIDDMTMEANVMRERHLSTLTTLNDEANGLRFAIRELQKQRSWFHKLMAWLTDRYRPVGERRHADRIGPR